MFGFEFFLPQISTQEVARQRSPWGEGPDYVAAWGEVPGRACGPDYWEEGGWHPGWGTVFIQTIHYTWMETLGVPRLQFE